MSAFRSESVVNAPLLVLEVSCRMTPLAAGSPQTLVRTVRSEDDLPAVLTSLPAEVGAVAADSRVVSRFLADDAGRDWLAGCSDLAVAVPSEEGARTLVELASALDDLGLRPRLMRTVGPFVVLDVASGAGSTVTDVVVDSLSETARRAVAERDAAELVRWEHARVQAHLRAALKRELEGLDREDGLLTEARDLRSELRLVRSRLAQGRRSPVSRRAKRAARWIVRRARAIRAPRANAS